MLGGTVIHLLTMLTFVVYGFIWLCKSHEAISEAVHRLPGGDGIGKVVWSLVLCSALLSIRALFRCVELADITSVSSFGARG